MGVTDGGKGASGATSAGAPWHGPLRDRVLRARQLLLEDMCTQLADADGAARQARDLALSHLLRAVALRLLEQRGVAPPLEQGYADVASFARLCREPSLRSLAEHGQGLFDTAVGPFPRGETLAQLGQLLAVAELAPLWRPGQEELLGWVYQYFSEPEKDQAFERFYRDRRRLESQDIPAVTQLFTPRWIIEYLLQNTLGQLWLQLHPDSSLARGWPLLVPRACRALPARQARELRVLDPACGSMHFGLVAFELLEAIYREELERAGSPGWPDRPSLADPSEIAPAILAHNLFGVDLDPRALQIARFSLWLKAGHRAKTLQMNLRCADTLDRRQRAPACADVLVTNPPYMSRRTMPRDLAARLQRDYPHSCGDLYTAFLERASQLLAPDGRLGVLAQQSFMFTSSYSGLRALLLDGQQIESMCHLGPHAFEQIAGEKVNTTACVLYRPAVPQPAEPGTYLRLVEQPTPQAKRALLLKALEQQRAGLPHPAIFRRAQEGYAQLPGRPWVYWAPASLQALFARLPALGELARPRQGLATGDNQRFVRYWWEVGVERIGFGCGSLEQARASGRRWFPYMKGGGRRRWWGNQEHVVNWAEDGAEIRALCDEAGRPRSRPQNTSFYFRRGITYSFLSSGASSARYSPGGFIFDVAGSSLFPADIPPLLGVLNSSSAAALLALINPTVNTQVGDLARLPLPSAADPALVGLVERAITLSRQLESYEQTSYDFCRPPRWPDAAERSSAEAELERIERELDARVASLYGLLDHAARDALDHEGTPGNALDCERAKPHEEREAKALDRELVKPREPHEAKARNSKLETRNSEALASEWISYAVGIALGRHKHPAVSPELVATEGLLLLDGEDGLAARVERLLELLLGAEEARQVVATSAQDLSLERYLARGWWQQHLRDYRRRPIYWLLQSPRRDAGALAFHQRLGPGGLRWLQEQLRLRRPDGARAHAELESFARRIEAALCAPDERGQPVGWHPELDDGVLINSAPLHALLPAWPAEPADTWRALCAERLEWSRTARRYWPERVRAACRRDRSLARAHGIY